MKQQQIHLTFLFLLILFDFLVASEKVITLESGRIRGATYESFHAFRGLPYAEPPVGDLRFSPPKRFSQKWYDIKEFKEFGPLCAQFVHLGYQFEGSEDCLTLNVFVPKTVIKAKEKAPVIIFIHGTFSYF